jgi:hypothetical protein
MNELSAINPTNFNSSPPELVASLARKIKWTHGSNSAALETLPATDYTLVPTGKLLERKIVPMTGEIKQGGMRSFGISQRALSGCVPKQINTSWRYASTISHSFDEPRDFSERFLNSLTHLSYSFPEDDYWDPILVDLGRLKQWDPQKFEELCLNHAEKIEAIKTKTFESGYAQRILKAIDYPVEELKKAKNDPVLCKEIDTQFLYDDRSFPHQHWTLFQQYGSDDCNSVFFIFRQ